jgi:cell division protein FtsB
VHRQAADFATLTAEEAFLPTNNIADNARQMVSSQSRFAGKVIQPQCSVYKRPSNFPPPCESLWGNRWANQQYKV